MDNSFLIRQASKFFAGMLESKKSEINKGIADEFIKLRERMTEAEIQPAIMLIERNGEIYATVVMLDENDKVTRQIAIEFFENKKTVNLLNLIKNILKSVLK